MKLLVTVAHPDDEAFGCGSVLAHAAACGVEVVVACATRGELGEVAGAPVVGKSGSAEPLTPARLGEIREAELRSATALLGVGRVVMWGWCDARDPPTRPHLPVVPAPLAHE